MNKIRSLNKKRAVSAKAAGQKKQIYSGQKQNHKKVYRTHTESSQIDYINNERKSRLYTSGIQNISRFTQQVNKQAQILVQQNFHLKNELNDLNNRLYLTRFKIQSQKKKHLLYAKKLNRQFEKQLYWPKQKQNDYLIMGVKHQYQILKQKYQQKCQEFDVLHKSITCTEVHQISAYCEALQIQNRILLENISHLKRNKSKYSNSNQFSLSLSKSKFQAEKNDYLHQQDQKNLKKYQNKYQRLEQQFEKQSFQLKEYEKKIKFLQKLVIQKSNQSYHSHRKTKAIQKQKNKLLNNLKSFELKIIQKETQYQNDLNQFKTANARQTKMEKQMFQRIFKQKNQTIQKLQKQIAYLSTLLSYWKPLDEVQKFDRIDQSISIKDKTISVQNGLSNFQGNSRELPNRSKTPLNIMTGRDQNSLEEGKFGSLSDQLILNKDSVNQTINNLEAEKQDFQNRQPRKSTKKWSEQSKKCRKVPMSEIQYLGELVRYKMIASKKSLDQVKEYFSLKLSKSMISKIQEEFITMKQVKGILTSNPFSLQEDQAYLLSRYIIEDQGVQFVYCHEKNELQRSIVKSIIRTLIGQYQVPDQQKCENKWKQIKKIYSHNMQLALKSICPKGIITKDKFLQLIGSLGIQIEDETKNYLIGKLIQNQKSLSHLKYDDLFTNQEKLN